MTDETTPISPTSAGSPTPPIPPVLPNKEAEEEVAHLLTMLGRLEKSFGLPAGLNLENLFDFVPIVGEVEVRLWVTSIPPVVILYRSVLELLVKNTLPQLDYLRLVTILRFYYLRYYADRYKIVFIRSLDNLNHDFPFVPFIKYRYTFRDESIQIVTDEELKALGYPTKKSRRKV